MVRSLRGLGERVVLEMKAGLVEVIGDTLRVPQPPKTRAPDPALVAEHGYSDKRGSSMAYVWAPLAEGLLLARFFFLAGGAVIEDPATGSACANLGGWMLATKRPLPIDLRIRQGEAVARPSLLGLRVDEEQRIFVSGAVHDLGGGKLHL